MSARAEAKSLSLRYEELSPLPHGILADETRLRQVLLNLLGNAVKFTDRGHVSLTVKVLDTTEPEPGEPQATVCFSVEDTGIGLAPDQLEGIFNSFEQMHAVDRREEGAGLGLAISRQIVQLMGSQLRVQSVVGQGSTFWFDTALPIATITEPEQPTLPVRRITGYEGARRMVLVVDDKLYNRLVVRDLLEPLGFVVHTVEDGQQAVQKAVELRPDAIIMDLVMPVKTGIEAVREIRETPDLKDVPTIAMSASVLKAEQEQSRVAGCNAFLPKPINTEQLLDLLSEHLKLSWIYAGPEVPADTILTPLPRDMLAELNEMARKGDILQIQKHALHLEKMDIAYLPFVHKLQKLAQGFEIDKIKEFIHNWIEEKHDEHE
jgi:CheY-like chemotaxis protein